MNIQVPLNTEQPASPPPTRNGSQPWSVNSLSLFVFLDQEHVNNPREGVETPSRLEHVRLARDAWAI